MFDNPSYPNGRTKGRRNLLSYLDGMPRFGDRELYFWKEGVRWRSRSYARVHDRALSCAANLFEAGLERGDAVLIEGSENADWVEALYGVLRAGGVGVPLSPDSPQARV